MHDHDNKSNSWMMWLMMACCILPILFVGLAGKGVGLPTWIVLGLVAVFAAIHFWGMHKSHDSAPQSSEKTDSDGSPAENHAEHKNF